MDFFGFEVFAFFGFEDFVFESGGVVWPAWPANIGTQTAIKAIAIRLFFMFFFLSLAGLLTPSQFHLGPSRRIFR